MPRQANVCQVTRTRLGLAAVLAATGVLLVSGALTGSASGASPLKGSVRITFQGDGRQVLSDYKQWIFQADQECYYDRDVHQTAAFRWTTSFAALGLARLARPSGRALAGAEVAADGSASGPEVRGDCASDDVPPGWVETINCDQALQFSGPGSLEVVRGRPGRAVLVLHAPAPLIQSPSTCSLIPRGQDLVGSAKIDLVKLAKLAPGKSTTTTLGGASEVNCSTHPSPYEGTEIVDECHDTLVWHGTVTITKS